MYSEIRGEADAAYSEAVKLKIQRENSGSGEKVEESSKAVSNAPVSLKGDEAKNPSPGEIPEIIYEVAEEKQFQNPEILVRIAEAESGFDTCAKNPNSSATGLFQILDMHGLSKEERCNPRIATAWAIDNFSGGRPWNSSRNKWDL